jgi:hypothetical protein
MAWTQADLDALDNAIKSGTRQVRFADREVTYASMQDLILARNFASEQIAAANSQLLTRQRRIYTDKGW